MKAHTKRRIEHSLYAIPSKSSSQFEEMFEGHESQFHKKPELKKKMQERFDTAVSTFEIQYLNGIELNMSMELRRYLSEFNNRSWNFGMRKMPSMFNVLEAFFNLDKDLFYWELLEEEEYLISYFDFIDYYTSRDFIYNIETIKEHLTEDLIYSYNVSSEIGDITFKTESGNEFVIAGISMIRRGNEVSILFLSGQIIDTLTKTRELLPFDEMDSISGREHIVPAKELKREAVQLNNNPNWWKVLIACRLDLETEMIDIRYVAKDEGNCYSITTDDITIFLNEENEIEKQNQEIFERYIKEIEDYNPIFELAKASLHLPQYFNDFENDIQEEEHETKVKSIISNPLKKSKYKNVSQKLKIRNRSLWLLNRNNIFSSDTVVIRDDKFRVETSGYWKKLSFDEIGTDKKGLKITGRTWVNKTESYFQAKQEELIVRKTKQDQWLKGKNYGYIYIMRNASFAKDIYKIGFTTNETKERAKQLSNTSIPDKFQTMREWEVRDCIKAEKEIHTLLEAYRVDPRREFFKIDMQIANETIDKIVKIINEETDS